MEDFFPWKSEKGDNSGGDDENHFIKMGQAGHLFAFRIISEIEDAQPGDVAFEVQGPDAAPSCGMTNHHVAMPEFVLIISGDDQDIPILLERDQGIAANPQSVAIDGGLLIDAREMSDVD